MDAADILRDVTEFARRNFASLVDSTLGQMGTVGEFFAGASKTLFDYYLLATPFGFGVAEEKAGELGAGFWLVADAMLSPFPEDYQRLGQVVRAMPDYFAHMSAGEWGSLVAEVGVGGGLSLATGGGSVLGSVARIGCVEEDAFYIWSDGSDWWKAEMDLGFS